MTSGLARSKLNSYKHLISTLSHVPELASGHHPRPQRLIATYDLTVNVQVLYVEGYVDIRNQVSDIESRKRVTGTLKYVMGW